MIVSHERSVAAGELAAELERLGGRLMMLFVAGGSTPDGRELRAIVRSDETVIVLRAPMAGAAYPRSLRRCRPRIGSSARSTICSGSSPRAILG